jgi:hypothetical protein
MTAAMNAGQLQKKRATTALTCNAIRKMPLPQFVLRRFGSVVCVWCPVVIKTFLLFVLQVFKHRDEQKSAVADENYKTTTLAN